MQTYWQDCLISDIEDWTKNLFSKTNLERENICIVKTIKIIEAQKHFAKEAGFQGLSENINNNLDCSVK